MFQIGYIVFFPVSWNLGWNSISLFFYLFLDSYCIFISGWLITDILFLLNHHKLLIQTHSSFSSVSLKNIFRFLNLSDKLVKFISLQMIDINSLGDNLMKWFINKVVFSSHHFEDLNKKSSYIFWGILDLRILLLGFLIIKFERHSMAIRLIVLKGKLVGFGNELLNVHR